MKSFLIIYLLTLPNGAYIEAVGEKIRASSEDMCEIVAIERANRLKESILRQTGEEDNIFFTDIRARCEAGEVFQSNIR